MPGRAVHWSCVLTLAVGLVTVTGCEDPDDASDTTGGGDDDGEWDVEDPERHVYDDSKLPKVELPADEAEWDSLPVPYPQTGKDSGEPGIVYSAAMASYYILGQQDTDLGYHYEYDPILDEFTEADNVHRKAVCAFTMTWMYRFSQREEFRLGAQAVLTYLVDQATIYDDDSKRLRDLGATSLVLMGLTAQQTLAPQSGWEADIDAFGKHMLSLIGEDGAFTEGNPLMMAQAHQALWRLYDYTKDERYLDALENVAKFFSDNRDDEEWISWRYLYGLWANEPLTDLYGERPADWVAEFVYWVTDYVIERQFTPLHDVDDAWIGGYYQNSDDQSEAPGWNSILKLEAAIDAYRMAERHGDDERKALYRKSSIIGAAFLQGLQLRLGETDDFAQGDMVLGGLPFGLTNPTVRVEVPGHMANAIFKVVEYMDLEDYPGRDG